MWPFKKNNKTEINNLNQDTLAIASQSDSARLVIEGMHCVSCSLNVDGTLEDLPGVTKAHTDYAKGISKVEYEPGLITVDEMISAVESLGYQAKQA